MKISFNDKGLLTSTKKQIVGTFIARIAIKFGLNLIY